MALYVQEPEKRMTCPEHSEQDRELVRGQGGEFNRKQSSWNPVTWQRRWMVF